MFCSHCGKELTENQSVCPECGSPTGIKTVYCRHCGKAITEETCICPACGCLTKEPTAQQSVKFNICSLLGMVFGVLGFSMITILPGLILSIIGLAQVKQKKEYGKGFAIAGIICSVFFLVLYIVLITLNVIATVNGGVIY